VPSADQASARHEARLTTGLTERETRRRRLDSYTASLSAGHQESKWITKCR